MRNLLFLVGLPTVVMGKSEEDVVEGCGFVIRHAFGLFTGEPAGVEAGAGSKSREVWTAEGRWVLRNGPQLRARRWCVRCPPVSARPPCPCTRWKCS